MNRIIFVLVFTFNSYISFSQRIEINKDSKIDQLIQERKKVILETYVSDRLNIQIFNGELELCKKEIEIFKKSFSELEGVIEYYNPSYRVLVGNFKTRLEAERNLILIKKKYPNAFMVKPRIE